MGPLTKGLSQSLLGLSYLLKGDEMKSRSEIWLSVLDEFGTLCSVDTQRDAEAMASRVAREGDSFFTVTLPAFGKDLEMSLAQRRIPRSVFTGFARRKLLVDHIDSNYGFILEQSRHTGGSPRFLGGFLDLVFRNQLEMTAEEFAFAQTNPSVILVPRLRESSKNVVQMADAITAIRQLCLMFGKEKELCSNSRVEEAVAQFVQTDKEIDSPLGIGE
jgi:hypothetical protein